MWLLENSGLWELDLTYQNQNENFMERELVQRQSDINLLKFSEILQSYYNIGLNMRVHI